VTRTATWPDIRRFAAAKVKAESAKGTFARVADARGRPENPALRFPDRAMKPIAIVSLVLGGLVSCSTTVVDRPAGRGVIDAIDTVVVIYAENRAFDTLFGLFPGADGIPGVNPSAVGAYVPQVDRDGSPLATLPPTWGGLIARNQPLTVSEAQTAGLPNRPFLLNGSNALAGSGVVVPVEVMTRSLVHRYYNNIMQINGGRNDSFAAWSDAGGLALG
jgi:phospholipase C